MFIWLAAVVLGAALLLSAGSTLTPFLLAVIIAYIGSPVVEKLAPGPLGRVGSTLLVLVALVVVILLIPLLLLPFLLGQLFEIASKVPNMLTDGWNWLGDKIPTLGAWSGTDYRSLFENWEFSADQLGSAKAAGSTIASIAAGLGGAAGLVLTTLILTPLVAFYLLRDWPGLMARVGSLIPTQIRPTVVRVATIFDRTLSEFLRAQFGVMLLMAFIYSVLLLMAGTPFAIAIGVTTGFLCFIPFAGFAIGLVLAIAVTLLNLEAWTDLVWTVLAMCVGTSIESFFLTPKIVGEKTGLGPVSVILALAVMGSVFGLAGMLVAVPLAAVVVAVLRHYLPSDTTSPGV